ncbi:hypothetical protein Fot_38993 [Forsythia ovata]|uniref:Uncharacterized protein n=1 Tax=Forsythia ovata TaxID=205694 RepID=A0ABD1S3E8_9LAMI
MRKSKAPIDHCTYSYFDRGKTNNLRLKIEQKHQAEHPATTSHNQVKIEQKHQEAEIQKFHLGGRPATTNRDRGKNFHLVVHPVQGWTFASVSRLRRTSSLG